MSFKGGETEESRPPQDIDTLHSVMVFNIAHETSRDGLFRAFEKYGDIADVYIPKDRYRESRGFGFVRFRKQSEAYDACEMDGRILDGRKVGVQMAKYGLIIVLFIFLFIYFFFVSMFCHNVCFFELRFFALFFVIFFYIGRRDRDAFANNGGRLPTRFVSQCVICAIFMSGGCVLLGILKVANNGDFTGKKAENKIKKRKENV